MVLHRTTSSAPPASMSTPSSLTHQEVACLKETALALLVVVKRRLAPVSTTSSCSLPDHDNNNDNDNDMELQLETNGHASTVTAGTNPLCPWMPVLESHAQTDVSTSTGTGAWMHMHQSSSRSTVNRNGSSTDWAHLHRMMGIALQCAALAFETTNTTNRAPKQNDAGSLAALTTHLAHQLVRLVLCQNNNNKSNSGSDVNDHAVVSDWIRSTFSQDSTSTSTTQSNSNTYSLQTVCIVWHGMLTAQPVELPAVLLPVLVPILQQALALDESVSTSTAATTTDTTDTSSNRQHKNSWVQSLSNKACLAANVTDDTDDTDNALYLQLFEHALQQAPTAIVETVVLEALTAFMWPVALTDLCASYEWKRRRIFTNSNSTVGAAGGALLLRYGMSSILQQTMLAHHHHHNSSSNNNTMRGI
jgi:hypothetical protein